MQRSPVSTSSHDPTGFGESSIASLIRARSAFCAMTSGRHGMRPFAGLIINEVRWVLMSLVPQSHQKSLYSTGDVRFGVGAAGLVGGSDDRLPFAFRDFLFGVELFGPQSRGLSKGVMVLLDQRP